MPDDPTRSKTKRDQLARQFRKRWRAVRGAVREELSNDSYYRPQNSLEQSRQVADFREWFEQTVNEEVVEPMSQRGVRNGAHWTSTHVDQLYLHGLRNARRELDRAGYETADTSPEAIARAGHHQEARQQQYLETYQDVEDAARATEQEATREYRQGVREGVAVGVVLKSINDRVEKTGRYRTDLVAQSKGVQTVNDAAMNYYTDGGIDQVGIEAESSVFLGDEDVTDHEFKKDVITAGDRRVCAECRAIAQRGPYTLAEVRTQGLIPPYHPSCRCHIQPVPISN